MERRVVRGKGRRKNREHREARGVRIGSTGRGREKSRKKGKEKRKGKIQMMKAWVKDE